jgi:hypothetical protein
MAVLQLERPEVELTQVDLIHFTRYSRLHQEPLTIDKIPSSRAL